MSQRELDRHDCLQRCIRKTLTESATAALLRLSVRHVQRLKRAVRSRGALGIIHGNRGKPSNRRMPEKERDRIVALIHRHYADFNPGLAAEKLEERHAIIRDAKTIRTIMIDEGLWKPRKGRSGSVHRAWRQPKDHVGELIQFDGSYHHWFEERGSECCLLAAIDDATGRIMHAQFAPHEGVFPVFGFWQSYVERYGKPRAVYCDQLSTYKPHLTTAQEQDRKTQFQRAMETLQIEPIFAHSPQAKGRVERLFKTLQNRLVKELRLQRIRTVEAANCFLTETYLPRFNTRFAKEPASPEDLHRPLTRQERTSLTAIFARHEQRTVLNDFTLAHQKIWYQLTPQQPVTVYPKDRVTVEEWLDHSIHLRLRGKELRYEILPARPKRSRARMPWVLTTATPEPSAPRRWKPASDHPWRRYRALALEEKRTKNTTFLNP